jgi:mono/diheme cytochrome c family protein
MKRWGRIALGVSAVGLVGAGLFFFLPAKLEAVQASPRLPTGAALIAKGEYLATAADCVACHSVPGSQPYAGGLAFKLPFGTIYSSNITPDKQHGIGAWSDAEFVRAMRHGVDNEGRELYPAFPYTAYANMSTDDVLAIRAYLNTLKPVAKPVEANQLSFPFNQRFIMRGWKLLNARQHPWEPDPKRSPEWNRGGYLVEGAGHCGECHTPRNLTYGLKHSQKFAGAEAQGWKGYNITSDKVSGIGNWSVEEIAQYLGTGHAPGRGAASGTMAEAVSLSLRKLTPADLRAMAVYLRTVPPKPSEAAARVEPNPPAVAASTLYSPPATQMRRDNAGLRLFEASCASCHGWNGEGVQTAYGSLRGAQTVNDPDATNLIQVILRGSAIETAQGRLVMPPFGASMTDAEVAALANYVLQHFGNKRPTVTPARVAEARELGH